jgi:hypothetical protein
MSSLDSIRYNLDCATPAFIRMLKELNPKAGRWIQYAGYEMKGSTIYFKFQSSQNSLSFVVFGGFMGVETHIPYSEVYEFFKALKQPYIEY